MTVTQYTDMVLDKYKGQLSVSIQIRVIIHHEDVSELEHELK